MLWFVEKSDICNFADDSTIYSCAKSVNDVIENLESDLKIALKLFKDNQMSQSTKTRRRTGPGPADHRASSPLDLGINAVI